MSARHAPSTIEELCERAQTWANDYYRKNGEPTGESNNIRDALKPLRELAAYDPPDTIRAELLLDARQYMLDHGLKRTTVNARLKRLKTIMRWAAKPPRRWITTEQLNDLQLADALKKGRSDAEEPAPVGAVPWELVERTIAVAPPWLGTAIRLQWWTGMRPGEVVAMRRSEITERDGIMIYTPRAHKTEHLNQSRHIVFGPRGMEILRAWMIVVVTDDLFHIRTENGYGQAIRKLNQKHGIPHWFPLQIRHSYATRVGLADLDGARAALGHQSCNMTLVYAEKDLQHAMQIQREHG
jgi:integrase